MTKDKLPALRVALKIFIRFVFKLAFRVSGRSVPWDSQIHSELALVHMSIQITIDLKFP